VTEPAIVHVMTHSDVVDVVAGASTSRDRRRRLHGYLSAIVNMCSQPPAVTLLVLCSSGPLDEQVLVTRRTVTRPILVSVDQLARVRAAAAGRAMSCGERGEHRRRAVPRHASLAGEGATQD